MAEYERHEPEKALLHQVVREQLEGFLASAVHREQPTPRFIEQELRVFLRCDVLAHGFLRVHCDDCGYDRLVAFSRKRRGFCPFLALEPTSETEWPTSFKSFVDDLSEFQAEVRAIREAPQEEQRTRVKELMARLSAEDDAEAVTESRIV